jgi:hypothetical protein
MHTHHRTRTTAHLIELNSVVHCSCHPDDSLHESTKCWSACARKRECGHGCTLKCWQPCGDCKKLVEKRLPCGHTGSHPCWCPPESCVCTHPCAKVLPCGHTATVPCHKAYVCATAHPLRFQRFSRLHTSTGLKTSCARSSATRSCHAVTLVRGAVQSASEARITSRAPRSANGLSCAVRSQNNPLLVVT